MLSNSQEAILSDLKSTLQERPAGSFMVRGESGLGKTYLLDRLLESVSLQPVVFFIKPGCPGQFTNRLEVIQPRLADPKSLLGLFASRIETEAHHFSEYGLNPSLADARSEAGNSATQEFRFDRFGLESFRPTDSDRRMATTFWSSLRRAGSACFRLEDVENATNEDFVKILALIETRPDDCIFLMEMGWTLSNRREYDRYVRLLEKGDFPLKAYTIQPMSELETESFQRAHLLSPSPAPFATTRGNIAAILYNPDDIQQRWNIANLISDDENERRSLFLLTLLFGVEEQTHILSQLAQSLGFIFELDALLRCGIAKQRDRSVTLTHPVVRRYVEARFEPQIQNLVSDFDRIKDDFRTIYFVVNLARLSARRETPDRSFVAEALREVADAYQRGQVGSARILSCLLNRMRSAAIDETLRRRIDLVFQQGLVLAGGTNRMLPIKDERDALEAVERLLNVTIYCNADSFDDAATEGASLLSDVRSVGHPSMPDQFWIGLYNLLIFANYETGRHEEVAAYAEELKKRCPDYPVRTVLEHPPYCWAAEAARPIEEILEIENELLRLRKLHNTLTARVNMDPAVEDKIMKHYLDHVISPMIERGMPEIYYPMNNVAVHYIYQNLHEEARKTLEDASIYINNAWSNIAFDLNMVIVDILAGNVDAAQERFNSSVRQGRSPAFESLRDKIAICGVVLDVVGGKPVERAVQDAGPEFLEKATERANLEAKLQWIRSSSNGLDFFRSLGPREPRCDGCLLMPQTISFREVSYAVISPDLFQEAAD